jgi:ADP-ribose pyrophosphatase YjhB (NUDIX family)
MNENKKFIVRCRGIILCENKLLVVRHSPESKYMALPGGHLDWGEGISECLSRELVEELGIKPEIGRLLYVNSLIKENIQYIEFFFEVLNGLDYKKAKSLKEGTHSHEIVEMVWAGSKDNIEIFPKKMEEDFRAGKLLSDAVRYIKN